MSHVYGEIKTGNTGTIYETETNIPLDKLPVSLGIIFDPTKSDDIIFCQDIGKDILEGLTERVRPSPSNKHASVIGLLQICDNVFVMVEDEHTKNRMLFLISGEKEVEEKVYTGQSVLGDFTVRIMSVISSTEKKIEIIDISSFVSGNIGFGRDYRYQKRNDGDGKEFIVCKDSGHSYLLIPWTKD